MTVGDNPPKASSSRGPSPTSPASRSSTSARWDGKYSFAAERAGASRVVALDHYVWRLDVSARTPTTSSASAAGLLPDPAMIDHAFLLDDDLPGKEGFDLAHEYLDSEVEAVIGDFTSMDLDPLGTFDVVLYFGVLYHMVDPVGALRRGAPGHRRGRGHRDRRDRGAGLSELEPRHVLLRA